ncbi:MAG: M13 family metallopeptidase, partial [Paramuribaculum sp.]|nr:M13 family metallopeptidase [Paramuribaculum sp.]
MNLRNLAIGLAIALGAAAPAVAAEHLKSLNASELDQSIAPSSDFYLFVNKGWMDSNPLTPEHSRYGKFNVLSDSSEARVKQIVLGLAATNPKPGSVAYKVSTIYNQAMDSVRRNAEGAKPIQADLRRIDNAKPEEMEDLFIWLHGNYASPFFSASIMENLANSNEY